jgi:predicted nucleic acid-binding protein
MLNEFYNVEYNKNIEEKTIDIRKEINIKIPDAIIAATAITYDCTLVTRNVDDFKNLSNLKIFNPYN